MNLDLSKKLDLSKSVVLDLAKKKNIEGHQAQVVLVIDYSGSMDRLYRNGTVQKVVERLVPIAMAFDDNAEMECFRFDDNYRELKPVTLDNLEGYVSKNIVGNMGGTNYSPVIQAVVHQHKNRSGVTFTEEEVSTSKGFFGKLFGGSSAKKVTKSKSPLPTYVIFITDGQNFDEDNTEKAMIAASSHGVFFQFVGISESGSARFPQLEKLDDMEGRLIDNANFFQIKSQDLAADSSDENLYNKLLNEYPSWLKLAKEQNLI